MLFLQVHLEYTPFHLLRFYGGVGLSRTCDRGIVKSKFKDVDK